MYAINRLDIEHLKNNSLKGIQPGSADQPEILNFS